jgi:hypothetical protein
MKSLSVTFAICMAIACSLRAQSDPALTLAQILSDKGTISAAELARVQSTDQSARLATLAGILKDKGVLDTQDMARLSLPAAVPTPPPAPAAAPVEAAAALANKPAPIPVTTKKGAPVSLYGELLFTAGYNTADFNIEDLPMIASKQGSDAAGGDKNFYATARQTRLGLTLDPIDTLGGKLSGDFQFDLMGGEAPYANGAHFDLFRLRLAYGRVDWKHWAIEGGQDWSVFAPLNPTSLNEFGIPEFTATGNSWIRAPQVRIEGKTTNASGNNLLWQLAAMDPNAGDNSTTAVVVARQPGIGERGRMPSLESRLAFTKSHNDRDYTFGFSGHYDRNKNAGDIGTVPVQVPFNSWGIALDYSLPITRILALTGEAYDGRALGVYSVASGEAVGAVGTVGARGVTSRGGWSQLQFNWTKQWQTNVAYGIDQPDDAQIAVGARSRNQQYMANVIDRLTRNISLSLEYRRILTDYRNQLTANERGNHVDLGVAYIF